MKKKLSRLVFFLAVCSFLIAAAEGSLYYWPSYRDFPLFAVLLIVQNSVKAFLFSPNISISDAIASLREGCSGVAFAVGYAYVISVFIAPLCTATAIMKTVALFLRRSSRQLRVGKGRRTVIFGYHDGVKALLKNYEKREDGSVILVCRDPIAQTEELALLDRGVLVKQFDCLNCTPKQLREFCKEMRFQKGDTILLFEDASSANFSIYLTLQEKEGGPVEGWFYCACEDSGVRRIIADYCDTTGHPRLCLFQTAQLQARNTLWEAPLYSWNLGAAGEDGSDACWDVHVLIAGFGQVGQQFLLQAINQSVLTSENRILFDIVDVHMAERKSFFETIFSPDYVQVSPDTICIPPDRADGNLTIRFWETDVYSSAFPCLLREMGAEQPLTYAVACMRNAQASIHCMLQIEQYLHCCCLRPDDVPVNVRMELDARVAGYLGKNDSSFKNVHPISTYQDMLRLSAIVPQVTEQSAQEYNLRYQSVMRQLGGPGGHTWISDEADTAALWESLAFWQRESNRCLYHHDRCKRLAIHILLGGPFDGPLPAELAEKCALIRDEVERIRGGGQPDPALYRDSFLREMGKLEHRRWCYFMALEGWSRTLGEKDPARRRSPFLVPWEALFADHPETCIYDLLPLLTMEMDPARPDRSRMTAQSVI